MRLRGILRVRSAIGLGMVAALVAATPVVGAWQGEGGTKNCGAFIGYVHGVVYSNGQLTGPGGSVGFYYFHDSSWHTQNRNGGYSGEWSAYGDPLLDYAATHAACRNYG